MGEKASVNIIGDRSWLHYVCSGFVLQYCLNPMRCDRIWIYWHIHLWQVTNGKF